MEKLFDKILQGKMLDADAKLTRVSKELKYAKLKLAAVDDRLHLYLQMTAFQTACENEMKIYLHNVHMPGVAPLSNSPKSNAEQLDREQQRDQRLKPLIEKHEQVINQRIALRNEAKDLLNKIARDVIGRGTTVTQPIPAMQTVLDRFAAAAQVYQESLKQAKDAGTIYMGPT
ncbi:MAG: hypothetical protein LLG04_17745 [Parachlamydia sp.]|nr:hypothetical protein [Parachlamydia sp.]